MRYWLIFNIFPGLPKKNIAAPVDYGILFAPCLCYNTSSSHNVQMVETHSVISRFFVLLLHYFPFHSPTLLFCLYLCHVWSRFIKNASKWAQRNLFELPNGSCFAFAKCKNAKTQNYKAASKWAQWNLFQLPNGSSFAFAKCKNAKTQKCKKVLNQFSQQTKKVHIFAAKNEDGKPKIGLYIVHKCAENIPQMVKWDTPNGQMGYPKWWNGIPQMAKWDIPNDEMGYPKRQNGIPLMVKWDIPNGEMGYPKWRNGT